MSAFPTLHRAKQTKAENIRQHLAELALSAYLHHDSPSFSELLDLATFAAARLNLTYNAASPEARRAMDVVLNHKTDFPILYSTDKRRLQESLHLADRLPLTNSCLWKSTVKWDDESLFLAELMIPYLDRLRRQTAGFPGLKNDHRLPELSRKTASKWASLAAELIDKRIGLGAILTRADYAWIKKYTKPERQRDKRMKKANARVDDRFPPGECGPVEETHAQARKRELTTRAKEFRASDKRAALQEAFAVRLRGMLKRPQQT